MSSLYLDLLEALRESCHLPPFPDPIPSMQLNLEVEGGPIITIDFNEERKCVELFSNIGTYQLPQEIALLKKIAEANFLWKKTAGATLSVRSEVQEVYLAYQAPVTSLTEIEFLHCVEQFVEVTQEWKKILSEDTYLSEDEKNSTPLENNEETAASPPILQQFEMA
ncbi:MAG: type III secretion system chaperone [Chthoniobacterales bacterium]|nr:type III secretion system chaperone [Chthoniobacterales bacterium]